MRRFRDFVIVGNGIAIGWNLVVLISGSMFWPATAACILANSVIVMWMIAGPTAAVLDKQIP